jgi:hypothetical protein
VEERQELALARALGGGRERREWEKEQTIELLQNAINSARAAAAAHADVEFVGVFGGGGHDRGGDGISHFEGSDAAVLGGIFVGSARWLLEGGRSRLKSGYSRTVPKFLVEDKLKIVNSSKLRTVPVRGSSFLVERRGNRFWTAQRRARKGAPSPLLSLTRIHTEGMAKLQIAIAQQGRNA